MTERTEGATAEDLERIDRAMNEEVERERRFYQDNIAGGTESESGMTKFEVGEGRQNQPHDLNLGYADQEFHNHSNSCLDSTNDHHRLDHQWHAQVMPAATGLQGFNPRCCFP